MRILHILDHSLPFHSGYAFRTHNILAAQLEKRWQVAALTAPEHDKIVRGSPEERETIAGVQYYRTEAVPRGLRSFPTKRRTFSALMRRVREVVYREAPDILHVHSPVANALAVMRAMRHSGMPIVYEIRAFWEDALADHGVFDQGSREYQSMRALETRVCRTADHVAVLCRGLQHDLEGRGIAPSRMTMVPNGVNLADFRPCAPDLLYREQWNLRDKKVLGFIGSFFRYEGLDLLVEAFARLVHSRSDVVLLLIGGGRMEAELKARIQALQLGGTVLMPGPVPHERIPGAYALMDILVYPRYAIRLTELVTPLKPLEAMAMAKPVVASDIGGHRELIEHGHTGLLFPAGDVSALSDTLKRLLDDGDLRRKLAVQASAWIRRRGSWSETADIYANVYGGALRKRAVASRTGKYSPPPITSNLPPAR
jgi:PEP-CTERM/exosortase A-associated glycosyltransferase